MTTLPFKLSVEPAPTQFLLTVRGAAGAQDLEGGRARPTTRRPAPTRASPWRARSATSATPSTSRSSRRHPGAGELLIIDYWNSAEGLQTFFSERAGAAGRHVRLQATARRCVWQGTPGLPRFSLPAPTGKNERYVGLARGPVASREGAEKILTEAFRKRDQHRPRQGPDVARMVFPR